MARIRTIKPEFWTDETIVELPLECRLLFIGMWNFCDDQGFIDYRPKQIKMRVMPADDIDIVEALRILVRASLVLVWEAETGLVLQVRNWTKHQKVANAARERYSPDYLVERTADDLTLMRTNYSYPAEGIKEGKGREGKGRDQGVSRVADATPRRDDDRPEIDALLDHLDARLAANDVKAPARNKRSHDAIRLMLDRDGRTPEQITAAIDYATGHEFWRANILSAAKLREKFDQLRLNAQRDNWRRPGTARQQRQAEFWEAEMEAARLIDEANHRGEIES